MLASLSSLVSLVGLPCVPNHYYSSLISVRVTVLRLLPSRTCTGQLKNCKVHVENVGTQNAG